MKTKSLLSAIAVVLLSMSVGYAQRVEPVLFGGHPVINCDGMLPSLYTTVKKSSNQSWLMTAASNAQVYKRFAVQRVDNVTATTWSGAFAVCTKISGAIWRLPTQRELMLIWVLYPELKDKAGFGTMHVDYWAATSYDNTNAWNLSFMGLGFGMMEYTNKTENSSMSVRCIAELAP